MPNNRITSTIAHAPPIQGKASWNQLQIMRSLAVTGPLESMRLHRLQQWGHFGVRPLGDSLAVVVLTGAGSKRTAADAHNMLIL